MKLSREEVQHIALLARLGITGDDLERFSAQLSNILENFEILKQVDTTGIPPTSHSINLSNVLRDDLIIPSLPAADVLVNAPKQEEGCFRVKPILE